MRISDWSSDVCSSDLTPERESAEIPERSLDEHLKLGKVLYEGNCAACHQLSGQGLAGAFPPLANSDYLMAREDKGAGIILHGLSGKIVVNGVEYDGIMPQMMLSNDEIASVLTYIRNTWGNQGGLVTAEEVSAVRLGQ